VHTSVAKRQNKSNGPALRRTVADSGRPSKCKYIDAGRESRRRSGRQAGGRQDRPSVHRSPSARQLATVITLLLLLLLLQWIREAILLRHSCVRATLPLTVVAQRVSRATATGVQSLTAARTVPCVRAPINLDRRQARKRRCGDVTPAIRIRQSQPVAVPHAAIDKQDSDFTTAVRRLTVRRDVQYHRRIQPPL